MVAFFQTQRVKRWTLSSTYGCCLERVHGCRGFSRFCGCGGFVFLSIQKFLAASVYCVALWLRTSVRRRTTVVYDYLVTYEYLVPRPLL
jgi:hypothetical protein